MRALLRTVVPAVLLALPLAPTMARAQTDSVTSPVAAVVRGPTLASAHAGLQLAPAPAPTRAEMRMMATGASHTQATALMIVGGAAIVGGLVVGNGGGDAIAVGGLVVGLIGLWQYLQ